MFGKVKRRSVRLPNVSIVQTAGQANAKLMIPKPHEARRAVVTVAPDLTKTVDE